MTFIDDERAATLIEYSLLTGMMTSGTIFIISFFGNRVAGAWDEIVFSVWGP